MKARLRKNSRLYEMTQLLQIGSQENSARLMHVRKFLYTLGTAVRLKNAVDLRDLPQMKDINYVAIS